MTVMSPRKNYICLLANQDAARPCKNDLTSKAVHQTKYGPVPRALQLGSCSSTRRG